MQYILFALAAITPALAGPIIAATAVANPNCQALVDAHSPNNREYYNTICTDCYDAAKTACSSTAGIACIEDQIQEWTFTAQVLATQECASSKNATAAYACIDDKMEAWTKAGNCKA